MARGPSIKRQLIVKSREAALNAVQTFNNPLTRFKSETFIVLMSIAWTYLLHAYYRQARVEYRYFDQLAKRRRFHRTNTGSFKYWDLERCLKDRACPLDQDTKNNLRFIVELRNEIVHHQSTGTDEALFGRYLSCSLNYDREIVRLFGKRFSVASEMSYALQLTDITRPPDSSATTILLSPNVERYVTEFDATLSAASRQHPYFALNVVFVRKNVNRVSQADQVIEFVGADSEVADSIDKQFWVRKETERRKYRPGEIVKLMKDEGYTQFAMYHHTSLWQDLDARKSDKGHGVEVCGTWYWYESWVSQVRSNRAPTS